MNPNAGLYREIVGSLYGGLHLHLNFLCYRRFNIFTTLYLVSSARAISESDV